MFHLFKESPTDQIHQLEAQNKYYRSILKKHHLDEDIDNRVDKHITLSDAYLIALIQYTMKCPAFDEIYIGVTYSGGIEYYTDIDNKLQDDSKYYFSINLYYYDAQGKKYGVRIPALPKSKFFESLSSRTYYSLNDLVVRYRYQDLKATDMISRFFIFDAE